MAEINKAVAGQSILQSVHCYVNAGTVRCVGSKSDQQEDYSDWTVQEKAVIHKFVALVAGKLGEFEDSDQAAILTVLDAKVAVIAPKEEEIPNVIDK